MVTLALENGSFIGGLWTHGWKIMGCLKDCSLQKNKGYGRRLQDVTSCACFQ